MELGELSEPHQCVPGALPLCRVPGYQPHGSYIFPPCFLPAACGTSSSVTDAVVCWKFHRILS